MEFTGRITADAKVNTIKGDKEVVNFSIAINDRFRPKGSSEFKELVTFINVAWWMGTAISKLLRKGSIVTVSGRIYASAYNDITGNAKASINCHADAIKLIQTKKKEETADEKETVFEETVEELPF